MRNEWFVSRQSYWGVDPEDQYCVEIAFGGLDYANSDMLASKYVGEGETFSDPREAVKAAMSVRDAWQADRPDITIRIDYGCTGGDTMPFLDNPSDDELKQWAESKWEALPKCERCGEVLGRTTYTHMLNHDGDQFCSEYCAEEAYNDLVRDDETEEVTEEAEV